MQNRKRIEIKYVVSLFLLVRIFLLISLPYEGVKGYGDLWNYFSQAQLGIPFIDFWTEFPPLFPFLSKLLFVMASGREHSFTYLFFIGMSCIQAGNIYLFYKLLDFLPGVKAKGERVILYAGILLGLSYGWGYFDPLVNFVILVSMLFLLKGNYTLSSILIAAGTLVKWFPLLVLPAGWKMMQKKRKFIMIVVVVILIVLFVWGALFLISPDMTKASLISQLKKGSWETVWALLDGNINTGNFGPNIDRLAPESINELEPQQAVISPWVTLLIFTAAGLIIFFSVGVTDAEGFINFTAVTIVLFFIWSPGYSPQWMLYFLPFILCLFPFRQSLLISLIWTFVHLMEWPIFLSRGLFRTLYFVVPLRTGLLVLLGIMFYQNLRDNNQITHEVGQ